MCAVVTARGGAGGPKEDAGILLRSTDAAPRGDDRAHPPLLASRSRPDRAAGRGRTTDGHLDDDGQAAERLHVGDGGVRDRRRAAARAVPDQQPPRGPGGGACQGVDDPARSDAVRPLLDWSDPYFVYWTYGKIWLPIFLTLTVAAWVVYRRRRPLGAERLAWRIQLGAYAVATISVAGDYYTPWTDVFFVIGLVPMLVMGLVGCVAGDPHAPPRVPAEGHAVGVDPVHPRLLRHHRGHVDGQRHPAHAVGLGLRAARQCADRHRRGAGGGCPRRRPW